MTGDHIDYVDDTGFTADGEFRNGILYHAGMVLCREAPRKSPDTVVACSGRLPGR